MKFKLPKNNTHHHKDISVNLLPHDAFSQSSIGKILNWSLSTGRYIVIFTEMIVILTFLSRFTLDRQLTDLNEAIFAQQAAIESYDNLEVTIRSIQAKTEFISQLDDRVKILDLLDFLAQVTPNGVTLDNLSVRATGFSLESIAYSTDGLSDFVDAIRADSRFDDVTLGELETNHNDTGISFSLQASFAQ